MSKKGSDMNDVSKEEDGWSKRHSWLWYFEINTITGVMVFGVGGSSLSVVEYTRLYAPETMREELEADRFLIDKASTILSEYGGRIELRLGKRGRYSLEEEVLDIRHWEPTYVDADSDGFFSDLDIPYEGLTDDEKDAW